MSFAVLRLAGAAAFIFLSFINQTSAQTNQVAYRCQDNSSVNATYDIGAQTLTLQLGAAITIRLNQAVSGSGVRYVGPGGYEAYGKADWLNVIRPGQPELRCTEVSQSGPPAGLPRPALPQPYQPQAPQQAANPSFNCSARLNATEARICANPALADLDRRMASTYRWLSNQLRGGDRSRLKQDQRSWLGQRNRCGSSDACIEASMSERIGYLNEWLTPGTPPPAQGGGLFIARSWGGIVRSGPGTGYARLASLSEGEPITILNQTSTMFNGYPWFQIQFRGRTGYQWGGIICAVGQPAAGAAGVCN